MKLVRLGLLLLGLWLQNSIAQESCVPATESYKVITVNGVLTTIEEAASNRDALILALGRTRGGQSIKYDMAYNQSAWLLNFLQSALQLRNGADRNIVGWLNGLVPMPPAVQELFQSAIRASDRIDASELTLHVQKYRESILQGQKVLLVAHSQGNLYANASRIQLAATVPAVPMGSFSIYGVAVPSSDVGGLTSQLVDYMTNDRDVITVVPGSLPADIALLFASRVINGNLVRGGPTDLNMFAAHSFADVYLGTRYNLRDTLISHIGSKLDALTDPPTVLRSGTITATLTWTLGNSDVDLHVFEPNGTHVYYANPRGTTGTLDVDNTVGFGPEHYYAECNQLQLGTYLIGVNYYADHTQTRVTDPARAAAGSVLVTVPGTVSNKGFLLSVPNYGARDTNPFILAKVTVERIADAAHPNQNGLLKYTLTGP